MSREQRVDYLEIPSRDLAATKAFFKTVFGWEFVDYGPEYCSFNDGQLEGGFFLSEAVARTEKGSALIVFYSKNLEAFMARISDASGAVVKPIFEFPGGRRFHFTDPGGSEFAAWSDQ